MNEWLDVRNPIISYLSLLKLRYAWGCSEKQLSHSHSSQPHRFLSCSCCVSIDVSCISFSFCDQVSWEPSHEDICGFTKKEKKEVVGQVVICKATVIKYPTLPRWGVSWNTELQCQNHNGSGQIEIVSHPGKASIWKWHIYWCSHSTGQKGHMTKFVINRVNIYKASSSQGPIEEGMTILNINTVYHRKQVENLTSSRRAYALSKKNLQDGRGKNYEGQWPDESPLPLRAGLRANQETFPLPRVPCQPSRISRFL